MPILSYNFNQIGNAGQQPGTIMIETDDSLVAIQATGYLNTLARQNLPLSEDLMALVSINKGANKSTVWMAIHFANENWSLVPSAIEPSLNAKYIVQQPNATLPNAQAMSALATGIVKNTTTTGVQSIAVAGVDYQAAGAVTSVTGTTNRITSSGGTTPAIDISSSYVATVPNGGTGVSTLTTANGVLVAGSTATSNVVTVTPGSNVGYVLTSNGLSSAPSFQVAGGGSSVFTQVSINITPTQMLNDIGVDGVLVLASQGAHTMIIPVSIVYEYAYNSVPYATSSGTVQLSYGTGGAWYASVGIPVDDFYATQNSIIQDVCKFQGPYSVSVNAVDQGIYVSAPSNFTNGNSTINVHMTYQVITTTT